MRVYIAGRNIENIVSVVKNLNLEIVETSPDLVITHGGDGALLGAEREFPGIPKLPIRDLTCDDHSSFKKTFDCFLAGKLKKTQLTKISGTVHGKEVIGINDVFIHNVDRGGALRYSILLDGEPYGHEIIGDGVGIATVHGSTAYYRSITHSIFKIGIGLAFNNSTEVTDHQVLPEDTEIQILLTRGPAMLIADNSPQTITLKAGDRVIMKKIKDQAVIYGLDTFMCAKCRKLRHSASRNS